MSVTKGGYWQGLDIIRVAAIVGVVFIHVVQSELRTSPNLDWQWWSLNITQSLFIWAAPAFVIISGILLLNPQKKEEEPHDFYRKRLPKVGIPLLFWGCVYIQLEPRWDSSRTLEVILHGIFIGHISEHLYFLFAIIGLYLLTPYLRSWLAKLSEHQERLVLVGIFSTLILIEIVQSLAGIYVFLFATQWIPFLGYYLFGHYISRYQTRPIHFFFYLALSATNVPLNSIGKYIERISATHTISYFYSTKYNSVTAVVLTIGIFGVLFMLTESISEDGAIARICRFLNPRVFGIYLIHILLLRGFHYYFGITYPTEAATALIESLIVIIFSLLGLSIINLVPGGWWVVGFSTPVISAVSPKVESQEQLMRAQIPTE
jgi:surface polysaccharide O-acyltransferase-like enzyme